MLETEPAAWTLKFNGRINAPTTFSTREGAEKYVRICYASREHLRAMGFTLEDENIEIVPLFERSAPTGAGE